MRSAGVYVCLPVHLRGLNMLHSYLFHRRKQLVQMSYEEEIEIAVSEPVNSKRSNTPLTLHVNIEDDRTPHVVQQIQQERRPEDEERPFQLQQDRRRQQEGRPYCGFCFCFIIFIIMVLLVTGVMWYFRSGSLKTTMNLKGATTAVPDTQSPSLLAYISMPFVYIIHLFNGSDSSPESSTSTTKFGLTPGYLRASLEIQESMNIGVDPCVDFYEYACGNYPKIHPIPDDRANYMELIRLEKEVGKNMKRLLESEEDSSSQAIQKIKTMFKVCMKNDHVGKGEKIAISMIREIGSWPLIEGSASWNPSQFDLQRLLDSLPKHGLMQSPLFDISFHRDHTNKSKRMLQIGEFKPLLGQVQFYLTPELFKKEINAMKKAMIRGLEEFTKDVGLKKNPDLEKDFDEMIKFESELASVMLLPHQARDALKQYNLENFDAFNRRFKKISSFDMRQNLLVTYGKIIHPLLNDKSTDINLANPKFVDKLAQVLRKTDPKVLTNRILYAMFSKYKYAFAEKYEEIDKELMKTLFGVSERPPRWENCVQWATLSTKAPGALYVRHHFSEASKASALEMVSHLKNAFGEMLKENSWMDEGTRNEALKKLKEMIPLIGYDEDSFDDEKLDEYYKDLNIEFSDSFIDIKEKFDKWLFSTNAREFLADLNRSEFFASASTVNAFFAPTRNVVLFPAGILQNPVFANDRPQALNYGGLGSAIGHEITHGFDDSGKDFDEIGQKRNWWSNETLKRYEEKTKCMVEQYGAIQVPEVDGMHIDGKLTAGENIADNGGIREAYRAYQKYVKENGEEVLLPGLNLNGEQLFFMGFANFFCGTTRPAALKSLMMSDSHAPGKYRVNVNLANQPEFAKAFSCPLGAPMNPEKRCAVW